MCCTQQRGALERHDDLGVVAVGELGQGVELQDGDQRRGGVRSANRVVDAGNCLRTTFGLEDERLTISLGAQDGGGPLALGSADRGLGRTVGDVDRRLLVAL